MDAEKFGFLHIMPSYRAVRRTHALGHHAGKFEGPTQERIRSSNLESKTSGRVELRLRPATAGFHLGFHCPTKLRGAR